MKNIFIITHMNGQWLSLSIPIFILILSNTILIAQTSQIEGVKVTVKPLDDNEDDEHSHQEDPDYQCTSANRPSNQNTWGLIRSFIVAMSSFIGMAIVAEILIKKGHSAYTTNTLTSKTGFIEFIYREQYPFQNETQDVPSGEHHMHSMDTNTALQPGLIESLPPTLKAKIASGNIPFSPRALGDTAEEYVALKRKVREEIARKRKDQERREKMKKKKEKEKQARDKKKAEEAEKAKKAGKESKGSEESEKSETEDETGPNKSDESSENDPEAKKLESFLVNVDEEEAAEKEGQKDDALSFLKPRETVLPLKHFFNLTEEIVVNRRGPDAAKYFLFLRYIIYFLAAQCTISLLILVPVHLQGSVIPASFDTLFARSTIQNIPPGSTHFWCHVFVTGLSLPIAAFVFYRYSMLIHFDRRNDSERTLLIENWSNPPHSKREIADFLAKFVGSTKVIEGIQYVYDADILQKLRDDYIKCFKAWKYSTAYMLRYGESYEMRPHSCGQWLGLLGLCSCFPKVYGCTYYYKAKWEVAKSLLDTYERIISNPRGSLFITFRTKFQSEMVLHRLRHDKSVIKRLAKMGVNATRTKKFWNAIQSLQVTQAPDPRDLNWAALVMDPKCSFIREIFMNIALFILLFFCTTPMFAKPWFDYLNEKYLSGLANQTSKKISSNGTIYTPVIDSDFINTSFKAIFFVAITSIIPSLVTSLSSGIPKKLRSEHSFALLWRIYLYLLCTILIIPSLGLNSIFELYRSIKKNENFQWYCLFHSYEYSFFMTYIIQATFIGNGFKLIRFGRISAYIIQMYFVCSGPAEFETARRAVPIDFSFGFEYSALLFMVTLIMIYSIACPMIIVMGLIYMIVKYYVDRYNIYHCMVMGTVTFKIHRRSVIIVYVSLLFMCFQVFSLIYVQQAPTEVISFGACIFLGGAFMTLVFLMANRKIPGQMKAGETVEESNWCACYYVPGILPTLGSSKTGSKHPENDGHEDQHVPENDENEERRIKRDNIAQINKIVRPADASGQCC